MLLRRNYFSGIRIGFRACCSAILVLFLCCSQAQVATSPQSMYTQTDRPVIYRDASTGITLTVESDGRHIVATNGHNETMWRADPFSDTKLKLYRTVSPRIIHIGSYDGAYGLSKESSASIVINSTQFGRIILSTGEFIFLGQD